MKKYVKSFILMASVGLITEGFYMLVGAKTPELSVKLTALVIFGVVLANTMYKNEKY